VGAPARSFVGLVCAERAPSVDAEVGDAQEGDVNAFTARVRSPVTRPAGMGATPRIHLTIYYTRGRVSALYLR
jgi:hypothetical protein